jgi:hypothetical protein
MWEPNAQQAKEIVARSLPRDFIAFNAIYLGRRNPLSKIFHHDPITPIIEKMTREELPSFGFYREPRNDYAIEKAKLRRVQLIYADNTMQPFEASINDLASLIAIQERGEQAHEKKVEQSKKEHHGVKFTPEQNLVLENLLRAFALNPIAPADHHQ